MDIIPFRFPGLPQVGCAFTTIAAGSFALDSLSDGQARRHWAERRQTLLQKLGLERWTECRQVHGDRMLINPGATFPEEASWREADGHCTDETGLALAIKTADCQPILLAHRGGRHIAALHVGWRGNVLNFPASGVQAFCRAYGLDPKDVLAVRGPSLGAAEFVNVEKEWPACFRPWFDAQSQTMDLWRLTRDQLLAAGLHPGNIFSLDLCTLSLPGLLFSHRRGDSGRQAALIWLE